MKQDMTKAAPAGPGRDGKGDGAMAGAREREQRVKKNSDVIGENLMCKIPILGAPFRHFRDMDRDTEHKKELDRESHEAMHRGNMRITQDRAAEIYKEGGARRAQEKKDGLDLC